LNIGGRVQGSRSRIHKLLKSSSKVQINFIFFTEKSLGVLCVGVPPLYGGMVAVYYLRCPLSPFSHFPLRSVSLLARRLPFVPSFLRSFVPLFLRSFVPSFLHPFTPSSHRHPTRSILLLLLVGVAFYLMATGLFKQTIDCLQQVLGKIKKV
jgi:hypothetical protein